MRGFLQIPCGLWAAIQCWFSKPILDTRRSGSCWRRGTWWKENAVITFVCRREIHNHVLFILWDIKQSLFYGYSFSSYNFHTLNLSMSRIFKGKVLNLSNLQELGEFLSSSGTTSPLRTKMAVSLEALASPCSLRKIFVIPLFFYLIYMLIAVGQISNVR